jgi:Tfp pilus assembly protein PilO
MYAKRNSLTILIFLALLSGLGFLWYRSEARELGAVSDKNKEMNDQLHGSLEVAETLVKIKAMRDSLQRAWEQSPKKILNADEPAYSLSYINKVIGMHGLSIDFDFYLNDKKGRSDFTIFSYTLNGEGDYRNICALLWYITNNPLLYQIKSVSLKRSNNDDKLLSFVIMFEGYSMNKDWEVSNDVDMVWRDLDWETELSYDAFASLLPPPEAPRPVIVSKPTPAKPQEDPNLIDAERATLLAITNERAYLRAKDGRVVPMKVGDLVRRGRLVRLDQQSNQVEFELDTETGARSLRLNIEYN